LKRTASIFKARSEDYLRRLEGDKFDEAEKASMKEKIEELYLLEMSFLDSRDQLTKEYVANSKIEDKEKRQEHYDNVKAKKEAMKQLDEGNFASEFHGLKLV
jgi:hypothetical protein